MQLLRTSKQLNFMQKLFLFLLLFVGYIQIQAQSTELHNSTISAELAPGIVQSYGYQSGPKALWDIQFNFNLTTLTNGGLGMAGICHYPAGNEFWVSRWSDDTIRRITEAGALTQTFTIPGLSGVRAFTTDGAYIYASNATTTIYRIDPVTRTLAPPHITAPASARHCTYDPSANSNSGGFWIGNFNTDIIQISMTGATLQTIPAATHGLSGMYGSAYDDVSIGGPFLWVFAQMSPNNVQIIRLDLATGTQTGIAHDAMSDIGLAAGLSSGLAGGLFISDGIVSGQKTIGGIIQGTPSNILFGYELNEPSTTAIDASIDLLRSTKGYTQIPEVQAQLDSFSLELSSFGGQTIDTVYIDYTIRKGATVVWTNTQLNTNINSTTNLLTASYLPNSGKGVYTLEAIARTGSLQPDTNPANDTAYFSFELTDSTFSRDDMIHDGGTGYAVSTIDWAYAVTRYNLVQADTVTGIHISIATPVDGDTTYAVVVNSTAGLPAPDSVLVLGEPVIIQTGVQDYWLRIPGGYPLAAGEYYFGAYEMANSTINLKQSNNYYTPGVNYFYTGGSATWTASGIQTARFIHPCFSNSGLPSGLNPIANSLSLRIFPNPTTDQLFIHFEDANMGKVEMDIINNIGQVVRSRQANPKAELMANFDLADLPTGIYYLRIRTEAGIQSYPVVKK